MRPVIERVAQRARNHPRPGNELLVWQGISAAIALWHLNAVSAHGPPLVMVSFQPDFAEIAEAPVSGNVGGAEMGVVVQDGLWFRVFAKQPARRFAGEQKVVAQERTHGNMLSTFRLLRNRKPTPLARECDNTGQNRNYRSSRAGHKTNGKNIVNS